MDRDKLSFDGELLVRAKGDFDRWRPFPAEIKANGGAVRTVPNALMLCAPLAGRVRLHDLRRDGASSRLIGKEKRQQKTLINSLRAVLGREILEVLLEGRLRVGFVIDSQGGDTSMLEIYQDAVDDLSERGGLCEAYVCGDAFSAAFDLMAVMDKSYALEDSILMWHKSIDLEAKRVLEEESEVDLRELDDYLARGLEPQRSALRAKVSEALNDPQNVDGRVFFDPDELWRAGSLNEVFSDREAMSKYFSTNYRAGKI
jgi:hypothetical protein